jgi:cell division protein FtsQ
MSKYRKIWELLTGIILMAALVISGVYAGRQYRDTLNEEITVYIEDHKFASLINQDDVLQTLQSSAACCDGLTRQEINTALLEESLNNHPLIAQSEVFSSLKGRLYVAARARTPLARVFEKEKSYYLDENGAVMPLSHRFSAPVILITGKFETWQRNHLTGLIKTLQEDTFFEKRISGLHFSDNGMCYLYPTSDAFNILLGDAQETGERLFNLKAFWTQALNAEKAKKLKTIDLRFNRQVICQY